MTGILIENLHFDEGYIAIENTIERYTDEAIANTMGKEIKRIFPKKLAYATTSLVLKDTKTEKKRKIAIPNELKQEIQQRLKTIERNKTYYGEHYNDYGLLICLPNGDPTETRLITKWFNKWQIENHIEPVIDMQGVRKSAQMYKLRINDFNFEKVALEGGHSTEVLKRHYNELMEDDVFKAADEMKAAFYPKNKAKNNYDTEILSDTPLYTLLLPLLKPLDENSDVNIDGVPLSIVQGLVNLVKISPDSMNTVMIAYENEKQKALRNVNS